MRPQSLCPLGGDTAGHCALRLARRGCKEDPGKGQGQATVPGLAKARAPVSLIFPRLTSFFTENMWVGQGPPPVPSVELTAQGKGVWPEGERPGACVCSCVQGTQTSPRVPLCLPRWDTGLNLQSTSYGSSALSWGGSSWGPGCCAQLLLNLLSARPYPPHPPHAVPVL